TASFGKAFSLLANTNFLLFLIVSMIIAGLMPFYFQGTAPFMQAIGIPAKNIPASMAIAQAMQALATLFLLGWFLTHLGNKWTLIIGAACWGVLYLVYMSSAHRYVIIPAQMLHGFAYVFFMIGGQIYTQTFAPKELLSSTQGIIFAATSGLGMFLGTQAAGYVMDRYQQDNQFIWRKIFFVPVATVLVCSLVLILFFKG
ncbi:MAG: MFS transporter, partial [Bacteroidales bacterium]|nr:MFS transporter [Bacteroidales bacterium]